MTEKGEIISQIAELFREHGYEGTSLSLITARTGLGKGSLYHFFPGGKEQMGEEVLAGIDAWFQQSIFQPLEEAVDPRQGLVAMLAAVADYFRSGKRICLVGAFALDGTRDKYAARIDTYFEAWTAAIAGALERLGRKQLDAQYEAEDMLSRIQGALVLSRARNDAAIFSRIISHIGEAVAG